MEMIDVGEMMEGRDCAMPMKEMKDEKHYPSLHLSTKQMPDLKGKEPGDKGIMQIEYEIKGYSMHSTMDKKDEGSFDIEIRKIGMSDEKVKSVKEEKAMEGMKKDVSERLKAGRGY